MQYVRDRLNRWQYGNSGIIREWSYVPGLVCCRALVRGDGKILSTIDCVGGKDSQNRRMSEESGIVIYNKDGPYLLTENKRFVLTEEINRQILKILKE